MKKVLPVMIIICIILLIGINVKMMWNINEMNTKFEEKTDLLQSEIRDLEGKDSINKIAKDEKMQEDEDNTEIEEVSVGDVRKDKFKVCNNDESIYYKKEAEDQAYETIVKVNISNKKAYLTIDPENVVVESIVGNENIKKLENIENKEITGFSAIPVEVYFGEFGQDIGEEQILFLMDDGSVEHIAVADMLEKQEYETDGKIKRLSNIKQFDILTVSDTEGGGYITTIAIDKDGYYYDINELL